MRKVAVQTVGVLTLQFSEILELLSYYDRMRRMQKRMTQTVAERHGYERTSLDSMGSYNSFT